MREMTENELELINIVRSSEDPLQALRIATDILLAYIKQCDEGE